MGGIEGGAMTFGGALGVRHRVKSYIPHRLNEHSRLERYTTLEIPLGLSGAAIEIGSVVDPQFFGSVVQPLPTCSNKSADHFAAF